MITMLDSPGEKVLYIIIHGSVFLRVLISSIESTVYFINVCVLMFVVGIVWWSYLDHVP